MPEPGHHGWHGFASWVDFIKATVSLGTMLTLGLWAILTYAMDGRYAPIELAAQVSTNNLLAKNVQASVEGLQKTILQEQIFDLRVRSCQVGPGSERNFLEQRLAELITQYVDLFGSRPSVPSCSDLR